MDIVTANIGERNAVYYGNAKGTFVKSQTFGNETDATYSIDLSDLDLDGDIDIVVGNAGQRNYYYLNHGTNFEQYEFGPVENVTYGVTIGDLDGDNYPDIITANSGSQNIIYLNQPAENRDK